MLVNILLLGYYSAKKQTPPLNQLQKLYNVTVSVFSFLSNLLNGNFVMFESFNFFLLSTPGNQIEHYN